MRLRTFPAIGLVACAVLLFAGQMSVSAAAPLLSLPVTSGRDAALTAPLTTLVAAVLPAARAVPVGTSATGFVTVINAGPVMAHDVGIAPSTPIPAGFSFQATDPLTNALIGIPNAPVSIPGGQKQTFFIAITPTQPFASTDVTFAFSGSNTEPVAPLRGINTLLLAATSVPGPDIVAVGVTPSGDGILTMTDTAGTTALAVATTNVGTRGTMTVSADTGNAVLPLRLSLCQTHPATGQCISPAGPAVTMSIGAGEAPTFAVFATAADDVPLDPAMHRVFVRFRDDAHTTRGGTSAAVQARTCPTGSHPRLTIANQCDDPVWAVVTAPGTPSQIAVAAQWDWMDPYLTQRYFVTTGAQGSMVANSATLTMSASPAPNPTLVKGMTVRVAGAGAGGTDLTAKIHDVESNVVTLARPAQTAVTNASVAFYASQGAMSIPAAGATTVCVPDGGAPSGNFRFFMGCPALGTGDTDPFNASGCVIGSASGDLSGINTLFEPSFGCISGSACAFNASDTAAQGYPACQADPNAANCGPLSATDFYDISAVDGYTFALRVDAVPPLSGTCSAASKDASMLDLASCPSEDGRTLHSDDPTQQALIATGLSLLSTTTQQAVSGPVTYLQSCAAPYKWFETTTLGNPRNPTLTTPSCSGGSCNAVSYYAAAGCDPTACAACAAGDSTCTISKCTSCPGGSGPQQKVGPKGTGEKAIQNTNFVQRLRALDYRGYTWQYDDGVGGQTCTAGAKLKVTLCPSGSSGKPYQANPLWTFSSTTGSCSTDGSTGTPNRTTTFGSLFDCQSAKMQYTCTDLTASDPFGLPIGIWAADPAATLAPTPLSRTYADFQQRQKLECQDFTVNPGIPSAGEMLVPNCTYYFEFKEEEKVADVCP